MAGDVEHIEDGSAVRNATDTSPSSARRQSAKPKSRPSSTVTMPIAISRIAPATAAATATTTSSDVASPASSASDYHSVLSNPSAAALLANLSPRPRSRNRSDSFSSATGSSFVEDTSQINLTADADISSDVDSVRNTASLLSQPRRRRRELSSGPALLKPRPPSVATSSSIGSSFDLDSLDEARERALSEHSSTATLRQAKGKTKAPAITAAQAHDTAGAARATDQEAVTARLRKLQGNTLKAGAEQSPTKAPPEAAEVLKTQPSPDSNAADDEACAVPAELAGHSEATLQRAQGEQQHEPELDQLTADVQQAEHELGTVVDPQVEHGQHPLLDPAPKPDPTPPASEVGDESRESITSRLRRRKGYRALSKRNSLCSSISGSDEDDVRTSSSALAEELALQQQQQHQSVTSSPPTSTTTTLEAPHKNAQWEQQMEQDKQRVKAATANFLDDMQRDATEGKIALNLSLTVHGPAWCSAVRKFVTAKAHAKAGQGADYMQIPIATFLLSRRSQAVKLMIVTVLIGSWFCRSIGLV